MKEIIARPLTADAFAAFGDVIAPEGTPDKMINAGLCGRFNDRALLDFTDGRPGASLFQAEARTLPYILDLMERHPDGSQLFVPMSADAFLVTVAPDKAGQPGRPLAFLTAPGQAVNFHRGTWHGVLTPLSPPGLFTVIDRIGPGANLEEHRFDIPYCVSAPSTH